MTTTRNYLKFEDSLGALEVFESGDQRHRRVLSSDEVARTTENDSANETSLAEMRDVPAQDETSIIGFTKVFEILNVDISADDRRNLIHKFGGDNNLAGIREFLSFLEEGNQLLAMYNMTEEDGRVLCLFRTWIEQVYFLAHEHPGASTSDFCLETSWHEFYEAANPETSLEEHSAEHSSGFCDTESEEELCSLPRSNGSVLQSRGSWGAEDAELLTSRFACLSMTHENTPPGPSCSPQQESITFTNVFRILNIDIGDSDRTRLIRKFGGDNVRGVVSFVGADEGRHPLRGICNLSESDGKRLSLFRTWFERDYLPAYKKGGIPPEFNPESWTTFCKSVVQERKAVKNEERVLVCEEASQDLSSLTPSHVQSLLAQGNRIEENEGAREPLPRRPVFVFGRRQEDPNDSDTSALTNEMTDRTSDPENIDSLLKKMQDSLMDADLQVACCGDIEVLLWERGGDFERRKKREFVDTLLHVLQIHIDHQRVSVLVNSVLVAFCDLEMERIPLLLKRLRPYENNAMVQAHGLQVLIELATAKGEHRMSIELAGGIAFVLEMMEKHVSSAKVQTRACSLLSKIAQDESCHEAIVAAEGLLGAIVKGMEEHLSETSVQCSACNFLSSLAQFKKLREKAIVSTNGISSVMAALQQHSTASLVYEKAIDAFCRLANSGVEAFLPAFVAWIEEESHAKFPRKHGEFSALITLAGDDRGKCRLVACIIMGWMQLYKTNGQVQKVGLEGLAELFKEGERILPEGVIPFVQATMERYKFDLSVQSIGCLFLAQLLQGGKWRVAILEAEKGIPTVLQALQQHGAINPRVRERGGAVLCKLARIETCDNSFLDSVVDWLETGARTREYDFCGLLESAEGDSESRRLAACVILGCMQRQQSDKLIQRNGIVALEKCCHDDSVPLMLRASWDGFVPNVFAVIEQYQSDNSLQENASALLVSCTYYHDIPTVVRAMEQHSSCMVLQEQSCTLLSKVAEKGHNSCDAIVEANGIPAVVAAMEKHSSLVGLQEVACKLLADLAENGYKRRDAIVAANGIPAVVSAMQQHSSHVGLQETACRMLAVFADLKKDCCDVVVVANGIPTLVAAMQRHLDHAQVQEQGCRALLHLAMFGNWDGSMYQTRMTSAGVIPALVATMKRHKSQKYLQFWVCEAFRYIALRGSYEFDRQICLQDGVLEVLELARTNFPGFVSDTATSALRALGATTE